MLRRLLAYEDLDVTKLPLLIDLYAVCEDLASAWESVKHLSIKNCWNKLYKEEPVEDMEFIDLHSLAHQIPILSEFTEEELDNWLNHDIEPNYDDIQIIQAVRDDKDPLELVFEEQSEECSDGNTSIAAEIAIAAESSIPVSAENFDHLIAWAGKQEKPDWISALEEMKGFAQETNQI